MKIGVLVDSIKFGGVEKIAAQEVMHLLQMGHDASLLVLNERTSDSSALKYMSEDIPVTYLDRKLPRFLKLTFRIPPFYFFSLFHLTYPIFLPWTLRKNEYEIIVSHNTYTTFTGITLSKAIGAYCISYIHDPVSYIIRKVYKDRLPKLLGSVLAVCSLIVDWVLVNSTNETLTQAQQHFEALEKLARYPAKIRLIAPGYNRAPEIRRQRGNYLITVSAWKEGKELEGLLDVQSSLKQMPIKIVGKWVHEDYLERFKKLIHERGVAEWVEIVGYVSEEQLTDIYANARALVVLNDEVGFCMPALEAAGNGCPFIVPSQCGVAKYFSSTTEALYFDHGDTEALSKKISIVSGNERTAFGIGYKAWEQSKNLSWLSHCKSLLLQFKPTLKSSGQLASQESRSEVMAGGVR